jgi:hypothetical protein
MMYHSIQQDIDLWEAWIEFDAMASNCFGTLYIMGEVVVDKKENHPFIIKCVQNDEPQTLVLKVQTAHSSTAGKVTEVVYAECLKSIDQYTSIKIYKDEELITQIDEIEVLV